MNRTGNPPALSAQNVSFRYAPGTPLVVNNWSADFAPGSITAITGASGCGKSTRMYLIALMLRVTSGQLFLHGNRVDHLNDAAKSHIRAQSFGFVFQDAALDATRTVLDNITETALYAHTDRRAANHRATHLMERFGIHVPANRKPGQISGGQAQRIALCRALINSPSIVLADEPTGNLDPTSTKTVLDAFTAHAADGGCVIVVTHDPHVAQWADRELILHPEPELTPTGSGIA